MRHIVSVLIALLAFSFSSCEKEKITPQEEQQSLFPISTRKSTDFDAQITIQARMFHSIDLVPQAISIMSFFMDANRQPVEIGGISVDGYDLKRGNRVPQYSISVGDLSADTMETFLQAFQNKAANIQLEGGQSIFPDLDTIVPLPSMIVFEDPIDSINISEPLTLSWKNAGDNAKEPVGVLIIYNPNYYANANSEFELPSAATSIAKIIDSGNRNSVTITPKELSRFPVNGHVKVQIGRGTQTFVEKGGKTLLINGLSHSGWTEVFVHDGNN
jgi:hypothetical protein